MVDSQDSTSPTAGNNQVATRSESTAKYRPQDRNGWPQWSNEAGIKSMDDNHIRNTIALIERKWDDLADEDDSIVADHWSLNSVLFEPGKPWYGERLKELKKELAQRNVDNRKPSGTSENAPEATSNTDKGGKI